MSIARISPERQAPVTTTPKEQIRASIAMTHAYALGERLLQADKANPAFTLADLRDEDERGIYIDAAASWLLDQDGRRERALLLDKTRLHGFAKAEDEDERLAARARADIAFYGDPYIQAFMTTSPQFCAICKTKLVTNRVDVLITDDLKGCAHGLCCAKNEQRFEFIHEGLYRLIEVPGV